MHEIHSYLLKYSEIDIILRLLVSVILGLAIGFEREYTSKWAGIKTHVLVALGSTVFTILSIYSFPKIVISGVDVGAASNIGDPARVAAQILTGIGFIGGGTVLRHGVSVYGLTTAASLWMSAAIGMAVGTGDYIIAIAATFISIVVLVAFRRLQNIYIKPNVKVRQAIKASLTVREECTEETMEKIIKTFDHILELKKARSHREEGCMRIIARLEIIDKDPIKKAYRIFDKIDCVEGITIEQDFHE